MRREVIEAVLFDFDGTLIDASEAICRSFNAALKLHGFSELPDSEVREMIGKPLRVMFAEVLADPPEKLIEDCIALYRAEFMPVSQSLSQPMPGLEEVVPYLAERAKLGIVTSRTVRGAVHILEGFGLLDRFSAIIGVDTIPNSKPHPDPIHEALRRLDVRHEVAVMVGDTTDDINAALAAGVMAVGITTDEHRHAKLKGAGADLMISELRELYDLFR